MCVLTVLLVIMMGSRASSVVDLSISGLPDDSCEEIDSTNKKCSYTFEYESLKHTLSLNCTLTGGHTAEYSMSFGDKNTTALTANEVTALPNTITLNDRNETIECRARRKQGGNPFSVVLYINYIPPPSNESTTEQSTRNESPWWLKFALGGGVAIIAICVVVCIIVCYRKKKPPPDDLTYENLAKDQKNYATLPVAAPRTLQNVKTKVTVERTYSEPKDSKDKSEALYADPNRCNPTETYAEPYVKSGSNQNPYAEPYMPKRDYTAIGNQSEAGYAAIGNSEAGYAAIGNSEGGYAAIGNSEGGYAAIGNSEADYAAIGNSEGGYTAIGNSEGNYAEIGAKSEGNYAKIGENNSENKELYAKPIPKAQRPFKAKNESDYSNVFKELYANANKK